MFARQRLRPPKTVFPHHPQKQLNDNGQRCVPSGAEARSFFGAIGTTEQAAEKVENVGEFREKPSLSG
jgi:hypothetical protein